MLRRLVGLAVLLAMGLLRPPAQAEASGLLIAEGGFGGTLEIQEQRVRVVINNGVAVTEVDQTFQNRENRVVEALYTFPVPRVIVLSFDSGRAMGLHPTSGMNIQEAT